MNTLTKTTIAGLIGAVALSAAAPAEARGWHRGGDGAAVAVGAGLLGLAVGAAIASDHPYYYDGYYPAPAYYPAYPAYGYYYDYPAYRGYRYYYNGYRGYRGYNGYRGYDRGYRHEGHWGRR